MRGRNQQLYCTTSAGENTAGTGIQDNQSSSRKSTSASATTKAEHTSTASVMTSAKEEMVRVRQEEHGLRITLLTTQKEKDEATMELLSMKKKKPCRGNRIKI